MQYDSETDKLVGFVLPTDGNGLSLCDSFIAVSFEHVGSRSKLAK